MRAGAGAITRISPWIGVGAALAYFLNNRLALVGARPLLLLGVVLAGAGFILRWRDAFSGPDPRPGVVSDAPSRALRAAALFVPASIAVAVLHALLSVQGSSPSAIVSALIPVLFAWCIFLALPVALRCRTPADAPPQIAHPRIAVAIVAATLAVILVATRFTEHWRSIDEVLYGLQAHLFVQGEYRWHLDPAIQRFFTLPLMVPTPEGPYTQYPPGYPAILAGFLGLGALWASGAILAAVAVGSTYMLGRRCASPFVGVVAGAMLATHFLFLGYATRYLSHVAAMAAITSAAWLLHTPPSASRRQRVVECLLAGFLLGIAVTIRPVTGIAVGLSLWLWLLSRRGWRTMRDTTLLLGIGMAIPCAALLLYNDHTNGSPFRLGYTAAQGHLNDLGFGMRGLMLYDAQAQRVLAPQPYAFVDALRIEAGAVLWQLARDVVPAFTALPLIATAYAYRLRVHWPAVAAFAVLPLVNFLYFENGERFYLELLPFALMCVALVVAHVWVSDATAGRALAIFFLGASVASSVTSAAAITRERVRHPSDGAVVRSALDAARRTNGPMLVFVRNPPISEPLFISLSLMNFSPFPGPIVVARDLGPENAGLICRMPGRTVMIAEAATDGHGARLLPTQADSIVGAACRAPALSTLTR